MRHLRKTMTRRKKFTKCSKFSLLDWHHYGQLGLHVNSYRTNLLALRSLVKDERSTFQEIWSEESDCPINFQDCGVNSLPSQLYELKKIKFEDVLVCTAPVHKTIHHPPDFKPFFLGLTKENWLIRYDNLKGTVLEKIYLGDPTTSYKFRQLNWETLGETILIQSTYRKKAGLKSATIIQAMAIFKVFPLRFVALFELETRIFGKEVKTANCSEGILILGTGSDRNGQVRMYSLEDVLSEENFLCKCPIGDSCNYHHDQGSHPYGLSVNVVLRKAPPILFQVGCSEQAVYFGGYPMHFIHSPRGENGKFIISDLMSGGKVGEFDRDNATSVLDSCNFHVDDTGRIVYSSGHRREFYSFRCIKSGEMSLERQCELSMRSSRTSRLERSSERPQGLRVREPVVYSNVERTLLEDDYENELEFYSIIGLRNEGGARGSVIIFDNDDGSYVKEIKLTSKIEEEAVYTIIMDLDTFVVIEKHGDRRNRVWLYRMTRDHDCRPFSKKH